MKLHGLLSAALAAAILAGAASPAFAYNDWPDVDFNWYLNVGKTPSTEATPPPRPGYIWAPGRFENRGAGQVWVAGHWVKDDFARQVAIYNAR